MYLHENKCRNKIDNILEKLNYNSDKSINSNNFAVIDAGAWLGDHSIPIAKKYKNLIIYAIEPSKENISYIKQKSSKLSNLKTLNLVLSDEKGYSDIVSNENKANAIYKKSSNKPCNKPNVESNSKLNMNTVDNLVKDKIINNKIGLLHFDVEGE